MKSVKENIMGPTEVIVQDVFSKGLILLKSGNLDDIRSFNKLYDEVFGWEDVFLKDGDHLELLYQKKTFVKVL